MKKIRLKKTFVVIGIGRFGSTLVEQLTKMDYDVLAIDNKEESLRVIAKTVPHVVVADATKLNVLQDLGVGAIDHAVVAIGNNLQASVLTVVNLRKLGVKRITVRVDEQDHKELFEMLGADEVIIPEEASAISLAHQMLSDTILDYYPIDDDNAIVKVNVGVAMNQTLADLNLRNEYEINIVGLIRNDEFFIPKGSDSLLVDDIALVCGTKEKISKFDAFLNKN